MKTSLVRTFFVASPVILTFLSALLGAAQATEDPAEVGERRQAAARASPSPLDKFRTDYRVLYKIKLSNPVGEDLPLGMYPREVSHKVAKLSFFGTPSWESSKYMERQTPSPARPGTSTKRSSISHSIADFFVRMECRQYSPGSEPGLCPTPRRTFPP